MLLGRRHESETLCRLLAAARDGRGGTIVVHGEPGIGKSALLADTVADAPDFHVLRTTGNEAEMELPFAALHQLCAPRLVSLEQLPAPQRACR